MLFKSNVPVSHRVAFLLAAMNTLLPLFRLRIGEKPRAFDFLPAALFWILVAYQWHQRQTVKWQLKHTAGHGHNTPVDWVQTGLDRLPDSAYWWMAMLSLFGLFWVFSRA